MAAQDRSEATRQEQPTRADYERQRLERVLSSAELAREILYAGEPSDPP